MLLCNRHESNPNRTLLMAKPDTARTPAAIDTGAWESYGRTAMVFRFGSRLGG